MTRNELNNIQGIGVPVLMVIGLIVAVVTITRSYQGEVNRLDNRITEVTTSVVKLSEAVTGLKDALELGLKRTEGPDSVSRGTLYVWCVRSFPEADRERLCEPIMTLPTLRSTGS